MIKTFLQRSALGQQEERGSRRSVIHRVKASMNKQEDSSPTLVETAPERDQRFRQLRRLVYDERYRLRLLIGFSLLAFAVVAALAAISYLYQTVPFDLATTYELQEPRGAWFGQLMVALSWPGNLPWSLVVVGTGTIAVGLWLGWKEGAFLLAAIGVQGIINTLVKTMVGRPRPSSDLVDVLREVSGNSFPSGHVMFYTVFFGLIFFLALTRLPRTLLRWIVLLVSGGLVVLIGPSRIFLGAHWLSDVVAGYLLSFVLLGFAIEFHLRYLGPVVVKEKAKGTPPPDRVEP